MKRMLINATQEEELRMAMVDGQRLYDLNIEGPASERKKANIYKGKITRIEPSLEAAFIDYGAERHGFLPLKEISSEYFVKKSDSGGKPNIKEVLKEGQDIVVQIDKEERGNKGAALTTYVSLAGRFIVLKPNKARSGGVSRRIVGSDRDAARKALNEIEVPDDMSVILRTAGIDRSAEELAWDLENLLDVWQKILNVVLQKPSPFLIYRESNAVSRALRDYLTNDIGEILIDDDATYKLAVEQVESFMPHNLRKLKHYSDPVPLFTRFQIESQIESAFAHQVTLPSGGSIVIDHTEALVSIDINSARATKGGDIEATALNTNLEAADEVARQLRIRDLGGLVVIDFIDMGPQKNQREVENRLREAVRQDRARVQIGKISRFGLLEMSRQRLRPSIGESAYQTCPRCSGFGTIRSIESLALAILRIIGEEARKERTAKVIAQLPVEVATYLLNEKRDWVQGLEASNDTQVVLVANSHLETPHYDIRRVRDDQIELPENAGASYALAEVDTTAEVPTSIEDRKVAEQAAIAVMKPATPAPQPPKPAPATTGFWAWFTALFKSDEKPQEKKSTRRKKGQPDTRRGRGSQSRDRKRGDSRKQAGNRQRPSKKTQGKPQSRSQGQQKKQGGQQAQKQPAAQGRGGGKQDEARDEQKPRPSRNRRSRGGRRRRRGADSGERQEQQNTPQDTAKTTEKAPRGRKQSDTPKAAEAKSREQKPASDSRKPEPATSPGRGPADQAPDMKPAGDNVSKPPPAAMAAKQESSKPESSKPTMQPTDNVSKPPPAAMAAKQDSPKTESSKPTMQPADNVSKPPPAAMAAKQDSPKPDSSKPAIQPKDNVSKPPPADMASAKAQAADKAPREKAPREKPSREKSASGAGASKAPATQAQGDNVSKPPPASERGAAKAVDTGGKGNGAPAKPRPKPVDAGKDKPAATAKPEGRLLPWEPAAPVADKPPKAETPKPSADTSD